MKYKSILSLFIFLIGLGMTTTSCEDMLTPDMNRYTEGFSGKDTVYFYLGILRNVQDMVEQNELLGDLRSDLVETTPYSSDSVSNIINYQREADGENGLLNRAAYFKVINQCNFYLAKVDTMAIKNNIYYMRKEYAQVVAIRAWAYLQLVQTYGEVPYITQPVENASTGWEVNSPDGTVDASNLVDKLKDGLEKARVYEHTLGYPDYGTFSSGNSNVTFSSSYVRFYTDLILGDLYLLRGQKRDDYVKAAQYYYYFMQDNAENHQAVTNSSSADFSESNNNGRYSYTPVISDWVSRGLSATSLNSVENLTIVPSAANSSFGRVLTRSVQIYGFDPTSSNTTTATESSSSTTVSTTGQVNVTPNYRSRQVAPSHAYLNLCAAQSFSHPELNGDLAINIKYYDGVGDARLHATAPIIETADGNKVRYIVKSSPVTSVTQEGQAGRSAASFKYFKSLYRMKQVYLRYAEAINRAGYPRMAFVVLRNGLDYDKLPTLTTVTVRDSVNKIEQEKVVLDSVSNNYQAANYIGVDELYRISKDANRSTYLDFSNNYWSNDGIHEQGCGIASNIDTVYTYSKVVAQRIEDEALRTGNTDNQEVKDCIARLRAESANSVAMEGTTSSSRRKSRSDADDTETPGEDSGEEIVWEEGEPIYPTGKANSLEMNAVETLIADECALEMAYEGTRMADLIRFANHKNNAAMTDNDCEDTDIFDNEYGTKWLAWKIARRAKDVAPYEDATDKGDNSLYTKLLDKTNWYIQNPQY